MRRIWAVAINTYREAIRNKVLYALVFFAVAMILASVALARLSLDDQLRVIHDLGLAAISLFSVIIAVFVGVNLVYKELERKTIYLILSKPIHRYEFILGRYLGTLATMGILLLFMSLLFDITIQLQGGHFRMVLVKALLLTYVEVAVVSALALFFSSFSSPFLSGLFTMLVFILGRLTPEIHELLTRLTPAWSRALDWALAVIPDCHLFAISGAVVQGKWVTIHGDFVTWLFVGQAAGYGLLYSGLVLAAASFIFHRRDMS